MTPSRVVRNVRFAGGLLAAIIALVVLLLCDTLASADSVDELIAQLKGGDSNKVRLSAALNLTRLGDQRAVPALTEALKKDSDQTVRGAAAAGAAEGWATEGCAAGALACPGSAPSTSALTIRPCGPEP